MDGLTCADFVLILDALDQCIRSNDKAAKLTFSAVAQNAIALSTEELRVLREKINAILSARLLAQFHERERSEQK